MALLRNLLTVDLPHRSSFVAGEPALRILEASSYIPYLVCIDKEVIRLILYQRGHSVKNTLVIEWGIFYAGPEDKPDELLRLFSHNKELLYPVALDKFSEARITLGLNSEEEIPIFSSTLMEKRCCQMGCKKRPLWQFAIKTGEGMCDIEETLYFSCSDHLQDALMAVEKIKFGPWTYLLIQG